ncbi:hypothetical protein HD554DRAFT_2002252, partial [Boletus coccyginus]
RLANMPAGIYGLSYDIFTGATEDDLPNGWNSHRMATHREVAKILQSHGFERLQDSGHDWFCEPADAVDVFWSILSLTGVRPPGKFQSTVKELKAHYIHDLALDITPQIRLGGEYSPAL